LEVRKRLEISEKALKKIQEAMGIQPDLSTTAPLGRLRGLSVREAVAKIIEVIVKELE